MKRVGCTAALLLSTLHSAALANDDVVKQIANPKQWASPTGDYNNHRYSKLDQINTKNVKDMKVAWSFSTGVLRGHEGSPLVIGNMMYLHTAFPNNVFALNLDDENKVVWKYEPKQDRRFRALCAATSSIAAWHTARARFSSIRPTRRSWR
jgi:lanthanide-dependent methanol dehydrogenase